MQPAAPERHGLCFLHKPSKSVRASGRLAAEELDLALAELEDRENDPDEHVHEMRKCMKRLRAVALLARSALGDEVWRLENACYRDAALQLAGARDATALLEALEALAGAAGAGRRRNRFATVGGCASAARPCALSPRGRRRPGSG